MLHLLLLNVLMHNLACSPRKLLAMSRFGVYTPETHQVTPMALRAEQVCAYDLDDVDRRWLTAVNGERALTGTFRESE